MCPKGDGGADHPNGKYEVRTHRKNEKRVEKSW